MPIIAVSMWPATVTSVLTSLNERDAISFLSITDVANLRQIPNDFSILVVTLRRQIIQYRFLEGL